ncbi:hypothetical protein JTB14_017299 [Gonioctena quinquepunctata]|nr:hypothetical protein JTB14_017299 [Gonioctena quinquepunctata]
MGNPFLDHMINRGAQILKDRSILYPSMSKNGTFKIRSTTMRKLSQLKSGNKSLPLSKLVHLRKLSFMNSMVRNDSCSELQITDILNELNNMTNSSLGTI